MDNAPDDRHVLAAAVASGAQTVATANIAHFDSPRYVESGQIRVQHPADFLIGVLEDHQDLIAAVLEHLARDRRGVRGVADVLDQLDRNQALRPFVEITRAALL